MSKEYILVTVSGPDKTGITGKLMSIVASSGAVLADMGQAVTHGLLSLSFLLEIDSDRKDYPVIKDLLFETKKLGLALDFNILDNREFDSRIVEVSERFILHCVASEFLTSAFVKDVAQILAQFGINIHRIDNVSPSHFKSLELTTTVPTSVDLNSVKKELLKISNTHQMDLVFLKDNIFRRNKRLIVFDMDSTLIQAEVIDELATVYNVGDKIKAITAAAMNGKMDFDQSLTERVAMLKGLDESTMRNILETLPMTNGAEEFIKTVKSLGYKTALISGGFSYFANAFKEKLGLDYAFANELEIVNGKLTGKIQGTIINANQKAIILKLLAQQMGIHLEQVVAIGDGANDLPMLAAAGLGIAYHAKEVVKERARHHMGHGPMTTILYFLGIPPATSSS
ncbi:MAG: phosphoserine phosphatase SerB [Bdellovibrio sp.]|nr:phosphoserine phosphatase SerB [Bdellovibrio sp.]